MKIDQWSHLTFFAIVFFFVLLQAKSNYAFNPVEDDLQKSVKTSIALDLSKIDEAHESNDLTYSPAANASYEKSELKWRSSPKGNCFFQKPFFYIQKKSNAFFLDKTFPGKNTQSNA